jgi:hypothetical protein
MNGVIVALTVGLLCPKTTPLIQGDPAPCTGMLWGIEETRLAVACSKVDLPKCLSEQVLTEEKLAAKLLGCEGKLAACDEQKTPEPPPEPETPCGGYVLTGTTALIVGFLAGVMVVALND